MNTMAEGTVFHMLFFFYLTHRILVDSSTVMYWMSPFLILRVSGLFCPFLLFSMENLKILK